VVVVSAGAVVSLLGAVPDDEDEDVSSDEDEQAPSSSDAVTAVARSKRVRAVAVTGGTLVR
jgi:hypothetical protein